MRSDGGGGCLDGGHRRKGSTFIGMLIANAVYPIFSAFPLPGTWQDCSALSTLELEMALWLTLDKKCMLSPGGKFESNEQSATRSFSLCCDNQQCSCWWLFLLLWSQRKDTGPRRAKSPADPWWIGSENRHVVYFVVFCHWDSRVVSIEPLFPKGNYYIKYFGILPINSY